VANGTHNKCQQTTAPFTCNIEIWTNGPGRTTLDGGPIYGNLTSASGEVKLKTAPTIYGSIKYDSGDGTFTGIAAQVKGGVTAVTGISPIVLPKVPDPTLTSGAQDWDCRRDSPGGGFNSKLGSSWVTTAAALSQMIASGTYTYSSAGAFVASSNLTLNATNINNAAGPVSFCFSDFSMAGRSLTVPSTVNQPIQIYIGSACPGAGCNSTTSQGTTIGQALLSGDVVNSTGNSKYLRVFSISNKGNDDVWVTSGTGSYVYVYAPNGQAQVKGGGAFFGAAFGQQLEANGGSKLHFDNDLLTVTGLPGLTSGAGGGGGTVTYTLQNWKQCRDLTCA